MERRKFINRISGISGLLMTTPLISDELNAQVLPPSELKITMPGIWRFTIGDPENITPQRVRAVDPKNDGLQNLPVVNECPVKPMGIINERGVLVRLPLNVDEMIYGLGLQLKSFQQRGLKKMLRVNADPIQDSGDSHAPVPFFVTTRGYGILIDTARYATFYLGNKKHKQKSLPQKSTEIVDQEGMNEFNLPYEKLGLNVNSEILIEIPRSRGIDIYVFGGPTMLQAVQRYNLFFYSRGGTIWFFRVIMDTGSAPRTEQQRFDQTLADSRFFAFGYG